MLEPVNSRKSNTGENRIRPFGPGSPDYKLLYCFIRVKTQLQEAGAVTCPGVDETLARQFSLLVGRGALLQSFIELRMAIAAPHLCHVECRLLFSNARMASFQMPDALAASVHSFPQ